MRAIYGFGQSAYLNVNHLNPEFDGAFQNFPQTPIYYSFVISGAITENRDVVAGVCFQAVPTSASGSITESRDTINGIVLERINVAGLVTENRDTAAGIVKIQEVSVGSILENPDLVVGSVKNYFFSFGSITENKDIIRGMAFQLVNPLFITGYMLDENDLIGYYQLTENGEGIN